MPSTSCDLCTNRVWSYYVKSFRRRSIYKKIQYLTFDLDLGVKVTWNVGQYPLHHVTFSATKFEVASSYGLGDTFTRNVTDGHTHARTDRRTTDRLWRELNIPFFLKKKAGITRSMLLPTLPYFYINSNKTSTVVELVYIVIPAFFFRKKGVLISCQSRSVRLSVRPRVRPSVTFLVNVSPPKPLELATSIFVVEYEGWSESSRKSAIISHCFYRFQWKFKDRIFHSKQVDLNWNSENLTSYVWARGTAMTSLRWNWPICTPWLLLGEKTCSCVWNDWYFKWKVIIRHSLNIIWGFYLIPLRCLFKLIGFSPKGRPKMRQFFEFL